MLARLPQRRDLLIEYLHLIQDSFGQLADRHLVALAQRMNIALAEVYEVATFYHHFDVVRSGDQVLAGVLTVRVCDSLSCEIAGAHDLLKRLPNMLGAGVRVIAAPCIGRCEQAPAVVVGQNPVPHATCETVEATVASGVVTHPRAGDRKVFDPLDLIDPAGSPGPGSTTAPAYAGYAGYRKAGGYALLAQCLQGRHDADALVATMEQSGLRGLGGAGFPAGRKWRIVRAETGPKVMAVNIDEGEPGTFKDRTYLERDPHRFLEGMLIAAWVAGIGTIYIYLRDEYHGCRAILERELAKLRKDPP